MKKIKIFLILLLPIAFASCNYLDVVPEGQATVDDVFSSETECQKFIYTLYSEVPWHGFKWTPDMFAGDDIMTGSKGTTRWYPYKSILYGEETASTTYYGLWYTGTESPSGRTNYEVYKSIRYCYMLLDNINNVPDISEENYNYWRGEAYALIAFYYQELLSFYGPIVIVDGNTSLNASAEEVYLARSTYDECVDFIAEYWDKAIELLPSIWPEAQSGRLSAAAALAFKARLYLEAASPLYNGNSEDYSDFTNDDGTHLINQTYDASKWERTRVACQEAIEYCESNGYALYTNEDASLSDFEQGQKNYHDCFCEETWNPNEYLYAGVYSWKYGMQYLQMYSAPRQYDSYSTNGFRNYIGPTLKAVEMYYSENGLPMDVDPLTKDLDLYSVADGDSTALLHRNREPRFYASVGYDRGEYDVNGETQILYLRGGEKHGSTLDASNEYQTCTGYLNKKFISKDLYYNKTSRAITYPNLTFPYIRLAELYLSYAEADFEYNGSLSSESLGYLDKVRERSGLPAFEDSWAIVGGIPTGNNLREILHQERSIEFLSEGRRYFDLRRWKEAYDNMNGTMRAWNLDGLTQDAFYTISTMPESGTREFEQPKSNWLAIPLDEMDINYNLVQNPGY